jgi:hypothetical protein
MTAKFPQQPGPIHPKTFRQPAVITTKMVELLDHRDCSKMLKQSPSHLSVRETTRWVSRSVPTPAEMPRVRKHHRRAETRGSQTAHTP